MAETTVKLQLKFEKSLLNIPHWAPPELRRAVAGWKLDWHEKTMLDVIRVRAELWCSSPDILVHSVWHASQHFPDRTFAKESKQLLAHVSRDVFEMPEWDADITGRRLVPEAHKKQVKAIAGKAPCHPENCNA